MSARSSDRAEYRAVVPFAKVWGLSLEEWLAYEQDMDSQNDYERWITEMEGEASAAGKQHADLNTGNEPF